MLDGSNSQVDCTTVQLRESEGELCSHVDMAACEACSYQLPEKEYLGLPLEEGMMVINKSGNMFVNSYCQLI